MGWEALCHGAATPPGSLPVLTTTSCPSVHRSPVFVASACAVPLGVCLPHWRLRRSLVLGEEQVTCPPAGLGLCLWLSPRRPLAGTAGPQGGPPGRGFPPRPLPTSPGPPGFTFPVVSDSCLGSGRAVRRAGRVAQASLSCPPEAAGAAEGAAGVPSPGVL